MPKLTTNQNKIPVVNDIFDLINQYQTIIIHRHQRPDPDAYGSQLGLKTILKNAFPKKDIFAVGLEVPGLIKMFEPMDQIDDSVFDDALVIVLDTANAPRIDDLRYSISENIIKIDHHPNDEPYGDVQWIEPIRSSTSEMIIQLTEEIDQLKLDEKSAGYLYTGIVGDTGRFLFSTNQQTLELASKLYQFDFHPELINQQMNSITLNQTRLAGFIQQNLIVEDQIAYMILTIDMLNQFNIGDEGTEFVVSIPARIDQVKAWAFFEEQNDGSYRVRIRSKQPVISGVAKKHNGGGHDMASGAKAKNADEVNQIVAELKEVANG